VKKKLLAVVTSAMTMVVTSVTAFANPTTGVDVTSAITDGIGVIQTQAFSAIGAVAPVAVSIVGAIIAVRIAIRALRSVVG